MCGARKGIQNLGFGGVFFILFAAAGKKYVAEGTPLSKEKSAPGHSVGG